MDRSKFTNDKREIVLKAIQRIDSSFKPVYTPPQLLYNNSLVDALNKDVQRIEETDFPVFFLAHKPVEFEIKFYFHYRNMVVRS